MHEFSPPEQVHIENDWHDGPLAGIADIRGIPHRFKSLFNEVEDAYESAVLVWPVTAEEFALEREQWAIFVLWNRDYERGVTGTDTHPAHRGIHTRWDEIEALLHDRRYVVPVRAMRAKFEFVRVDQEERYALTGPDYKLRWKLL